MKPRVLVLCTGNSCRSQIGEGWVCHLLGDGAEVHSAGTRTPHTPERETTRCRSSAACGT